MRPRLLVSLLSLRPRSASGCAYAAAIVPEVVRAFGVEGEILVQCDAGAARLLGAGPFDIVRTLDARLARVAALRVALPRVVRRYQPHVLWAPDVGVIGAPVAVPAVLTLHSHLPLSWPEGAPLNNRLWWRAWWTRQFRSDLRRARALIAPTAAFAAEMETLAPEARGRLHVVHHGVAPAYRAGPADVRERPAVLAVSNPAPYKNLAGALRIFARATEGLPHELRVAGVGARDVARAAAASEVSPAAARRVRALGRLDVAELAKEYRAASALLFPSFAESFGLPVAEAMACGTPVACSSLPALVEVAGGAAAHADPGDEAAFAAVLRGVLTDEAAASRLRALGLLRARAFSWPQAGERTARILLDVAAAGDA